MRIPKAARLVIIATLMCGVAAVAYKGSITYVAYRQAIERRKGAWKQLESLLLKDVASFGADAGIVVEDLATRWKIEIHERRRFAAASMVKVPVMASYFQAVKEGRLSLRAPYVLATADKVSGSGRLKELEDGFIFTNEDLLKLMITESDNTAANVIIGALGFDYLNNSFQTLGLRDTSITRLMMDFKSRRRGKENRTTAGDLASLFEDIYDRQAVSPAYDSLAMELLKQQRIRDRIPVYLPRGTVVAHKTGLENGVCHDAGIVFTPKGDFLICVLTEHHDKTAQRAKKFIRRVAADVYNYYQSF